MALSTTGDWAEAVAARRRKRVPRFVTML